VFLLGHFKDCCCISYLHTFSYHCIRVDAAAEGAVYAVVGTPGLGYPLLLCLGKSLVVILDYVQIAGPLRSGALFTRQRSRTRPPAGKGPGLPRVPEEAGAQPEQPGAPDLPWSLLSTLRSMLHSHVGPTCRGLNDQCIRTP